ncbi:Holliday junction branch migration protein RuvA [Schaalia vaccimaxillae]|uniref:Holliday junction branch migration protein RuvA n=1 Tax=Schaalia vaccimaxillae TaxID=183916 RepID=UPI0003B5930E|nr:Holliday junction branch migration protein RuvA [Schaalia vaccimaxillae]
MIAQLRGTVESIGLDEAVVLTASGIGFRVHITPALAQNLAVGQETILHTSMIVREDSMTLFGFLTADEQRVFDTLMTVSGIGPKIGLASLAVLSPDELRRAVRDQDIAMLQRIPGVGQKSAKRLALEIGDKLGQPASLEQAPARTSGSPDEAEPEVKAALISLGWSEAVAAKALEPLTGQGLGPSELLKAALVKLGGTRG